MVKAEIQRIVTLLIVLAVMLGAFATIPYLSARAANKTIWGIVEECGVQEGKFLEGSHQRLQVPATGEDRR